MKSQKKSDSSLKAIIAILILLLLGSAGWLYQMSRTVEKEEKENVELVNEKDILMKDLEALQASYNLAISEKDTLSAELTIKKEEISKLIKELKESKGDANSLAKIKEKYKALEKELAALKEENKKLKEQNVQLADERDKTIQELDEEKEYNTKLTEKLAETIEKASVVSVVNLKVETFKQKSSGKLITTEKAKKINNIRVCFTVVENRVASSGERRYYVQIIDPKNNIIGSGETAHFGSQSLTYSFSTSMKYENKTKDICESFTNNATHFEKGMYFVNVFDEKELVSKLTFDLK